MKSVGAMEAMARMACLALGDASRPPWDEAPEWQRASALDGPKPKAKKASAAGA